MIENFPSFSQLVSSLPFIKNEYEFLSVIGFGGSSVVFKVKSSNYKSTFFAAKVTPKTKGLNSTELNILKTLDHSYIIAIYDFFEDDLNNYLILEYCENGSLSSLIKSGQIKTDEDIIFCMKKLTEALFFCHSKGIAHRDIKPSNVLIDAYGRPKLIDFGICEILYSNHIGHNANPTNHEDNDDYYSARKKGSVKKIEKFFGSTPYLAPEVILKESYDPFSADVWSLGVSFYEIATGSLPWDRFPEKMREDAICQSMVIFPNSTSKPIQTLIMSMMRVDPKHRPTIKSILRCSLFKTQIPSTLKFLSIRRNLMTANSNIDKQDSPNNEETPLRFVPISSHPIRLQQYELHKTMNKDVPRFLASRCPSRRSSNPSQMKKLCQKPNLTRLILPQIQNKMTFSSCE
ncbi:hypothetical protein M9Y10_026786 [Tritrichomonas musculus]|uniref:Protein kinase domain-containing protein n=1 Tax=Tritrichomonas musculus TaxID=1915356 RepID=A0ABR2H8W8_9EUKA